MVRSGTKCGTIYPQPRKDADMLNVLEKKLVGYRGTVDVPGAARFKVFLPRGCQGLICHYPGRKPGLGLK